MPGNASGCSPPTNRRRARRTNRERKGDIRVAILTLSALLTLATADTVEAGPWRTHKIVRLVHRSHHLQRSLARPVSPYHGRTLPRTLHHWRARLDKLAASWTPWTASWLNSALCIHRMEGSWVDPAAPYYGGMQMDTSFASTYGPSWWNRYGTPDHWDPHAQLVAAHRAWTVRGWTPWPQTRLMCGV